MEKPLLNTYGAPATELTIRLRDVWSKASSLYRERYPDRPAPIITAAHRSNAEQRRLYEQGRTKPGPIVTNAKPGESRHNSYPARAFDVGFRTSRGLDWSEHQFKDFAAIVREVDSGITWGGSWSGFQDLPHFEERSAGDTTPAVEDTPKRIELPAMNKKIIVLVIGALLIAVALKKMRG